MSGRLISSLTPGTAGRLITGLLAKPLAAGVLALLLLIAGAIFSAQSDQISRAERLRQSTVQAQVLANGIAAPLAFNDEDTLREYLGALDADPQILAVGAYDSQGRLVAGYGSSSATLPSIGKLGEPIVTSRDLIVTVAVQQGGTRLGTVYLRAAMDSWTKRATRYAGLAALVLMAALLIATLGSSYASLTEAHQRLQTETASRMQAEEALRQAQKMEALGQLTGGVAHDFNNLLMVASGSLELMERTTDLKKIDRLKSAIRQAVDRGAVLTQQLLSFSRRSPEKVEVIDLSERISAMNVLFDQVTTNGISLALNMGPNLWPIEVDPSEFEVALLNIVINARDAMPNGGTIRISASNKRRQDGIEVVQIDVSDEGTGIPPETLERIFEPFFTTKGPGQGTGLGLSQVYGFARASGGEAKVTSKLEAGTTISLVFPRTHKEPARLAPSEAIVEETDSRKILLVEDNDTVAEMVGSMLEEIGFETERASSVDHALERLVRRVDFALVLSDMVMPGGRGGLDLVHEISRRWPKLPYVLMTGYSEASATAQSEGIPLIVKPFSIEKLSAQIREVIH